MDEDPSLSSWMDDMESQGTSGHPRTPAAQFLHDPTGGGMDYETGSDRGEGSPPPTKSSPLYDGVDRSLQTDPLAVGVPPPRVEPTASISEPRADVHLQRFESPKSAGAASVASSRVTDNSLYNLNRLARGKASIVQILGGGNSEKLSVGGFFNEGDSRCSEVKMINDLRTNANKSISFENSTMKCYLCEQGDNHLSLKKSNGGGSGSSSEGGGASGLRSQ